MGANFEWLLNIVIVIVIVIVLLLLSLFMLNRESHRPER